MFAKQKPGKGRSEKTEKLKEIARMEAQVYRCAVLLLLLAPRSSSPRSSS